MKLMQLPFPTIFYDLCTEAGKGTLATSWIQYCTEILYGKLGVSSFKPFILIFRYCSHCAKTGFKSLRSIRNQTQ